MSRNSITSDSAPKSPAYSQAVCALGLIFVSGQGPFQPQSGAVVGATIQQQTHQCLENVGAILVAAGSSLDKIASATFILANRADFAGMNEEWMRWFPTHPPARQGARLSIQPKRMRISIAVIAEA